MLQLLWTKLMGRYCLLDFIIKAAKIRRNHNGSAGEIRTDGKTVFGVYVKGGYCPGRGVTVVGKKEDADGRFPEGIPVGVLK